MMIIILVKSHKAHASISLTQPSNQCNPLNTMYCRLSSVQQLQSLKFVPKISKSLIKRTTLDVTSIQSNNICNNV